MELASYKSRTPIYMSSRPGPISIPTALHPPAQALMRPPPGPPASSPINLFAHGFTPLMTISPNAFMHHDQTSITPTAANGFFMPFTPPYGSSLTSTTTNKSAFHSDMSPSVFFTPSPLPSPQLPSMPQPSSSSHGPSYFAGDAPGNVGHTATRSEGAPIYFTNSPTMASQAPSFSITPVHSFVPQPPPPPPKPASLRKQVLVKSLEKISSSVSAGSVSSGEDDLFPAKKSKPLPAEGDTTRIDPRRQKHYKDLLFSGLHGVSSPLDRIRVWTDPDGTLLYDCVCGKRSPNPSLHKVRRHAYRHAVSSYTCDQCGKVFQAHWSLNAHKRIHKE